MDTDGWGAWLCCPVARARPAGGDSPRLHPARILGLDVTRNTESCGRLTSGSPFPAEVPCRPRPVSRD